MEDRRIGFELHRSSRIVKRYMDNDASKSYVEKITGTHGRVIGWLYRNRHRDIFQKDFENHNMKPVYLAFKYEPNREFFEEE